MPNGKQHLIHRFFDDLSFLSEQWEAELLHMNTSAYEKIISSYNSSLWSAEKFRTKMATYGHIELVLDASTHTLRCFLLYSNPLIIGDQEYIKGGAFGFA
jgi:hypothetical protein